MSLSLRFHRLIYRWQRSEVRSKSRSQIHGTKIDMKLWLALCDWPLSARRWQLDRIRPTMEIRTQGDHTFTHLTPSDGQFWLMGDEHWLDTRTHRRLVRSPNLKAAANHSASPRRARTSSRSRTCRGRSWASGARRHVCAPRTPGIRGKCDHYTGFTIYLLFLEFEFPAISFEATRNVLKFVWNKWSRMEISNVYSCMFEVSRMKEGMILKMKVWIEYKLQICIFEKMFDCGRIHEL